MQNKSRPLRIICLIAALCLLLTSCSPQINTIKNIPDTTTAAKNAGEKYHTFSSAEEKVAESSFLQLLFDNSTYSIAVKDLSTDFIWASLPDYENNFANVFEIRLQTKNGVYFLNTQDNSVALGAAKYENKDGELVISYILTDNAETAKKNAEELTENDIYAAFSVKYSLSEQSVKISVDASSFVCAPDSFISDITMMPYFGSFTDSGNDDYILVPDGSGAIMRTEKNDAQTDVVNIKIYGQDYYTKSDETEASGTFPVFGIKHGNNAFAAIITEGDALATVNANRKNGDLPSAAGIKFDITLYTSTDNASVRYANSYNGNLTVVYKFLSGKNANYSAMASAAREEFIATGKLSSAKVESSGKIPLFITIVGNDNGTDMTSVPRLIDILTSLKGKGTDNVTVRLKGFLSGGTAQKNLYSASTIFSLGGDSGLQTLYDYTSGQNNTLLLDIDLLSSSKKYTFSGLRNINGENVQVSASNSLGYKKNAVSRMITRIGKTASDEGNAKLNPSVYTSPSVYNMYLSAISPLSDKFTSFIGGKYTKLCDGFAVSDASKYLYSDEKTNRQEAMEIISGLLRAVPNYGELSVEGGNLYSVYSASTVTDMNFETYYQESENYEPVPFYQMILHGYTVYTGEAIDAGDPIYRYNLLRQIEYGAVPSFLWVHSQNSVFNYEIYTSQDKKEEFLDFCSKAAEDLSPLKSETIVSHEKITKNAEGKEISGVYKTSYSDGTDIYVNYSGATVTTPQNIVVGAYSYVTAKQ